MSTPTTNEAPVLPTFACSNAPSAATESLREKADRHCAHQQAVRRRVGLLPRFIMDFSLCRVAKALRLLGYDAICEPVHRFEQIVLIAKADGRVIVTGSRKAVPQLQRIQVDDVRCLEGGMSRRDSHTKEVVGYDSDGNSEYASSDMDDGVDEADLEDGATPVLEYVQVNSSDTHQSSLIRILQHMKMEWDESIVFTRCVSCNKEIVAAERDTIKGLVVDAVFDMYKNFYQCPLCLKVYWGVDGGLVVNYKALRTIDHMRLLYGACANEESETPTGGALQGKQQQGAQLTSPTSSTKIIFSLRRHFSAFPRAVKKYIFSFLTNEQILMVGEAIPVVRQLAEATAEGRDFVPDKELKRAGKKEEMERERRARMIKSE